MWEICIKEFYEKEDYVTVQGLARLEKTDGVD